MAQYAVVYAPNLSGGAPANTTQTGSFYIGNMINGRTWNQTVTQTTTNTFFCASPDDTNGYLIALPNPSPSAPFDGRTAPQFFKSLNPATGAPIKNDAAFINTCDYILKNYQANGTVGQPPINPVGCSSVADCRTQINTVGWQSYGFAAP